MLPKVFSKGMMNVCFGYDNKHAHAHAEKKITVNFL